MVRYPNIRVSLRTRNPLVLVATVRHEMRRAGIDKREIQRFSEEALGNQDPERMEKTCRKWVRTNS